MLWKKKNSIVESILRMPSLPKRWLRARNVIDDRSGVLLTEYSLAAYHRCPADQERSRSRVATTKSLHSRNVVSFRANGVTLRLERRDECHTASTHSFSDVTHHSRLTSQRAAFIHIAYVCNMNHVSGAAANRRRGWCASTIRMGMS